MEVCPPDKFEHIFWEDQQLRELVQEVFPHCLTMYPGTSISSSAEKQRTKTQQSNRRFAKRILVGEKSRHPAQNVLVGCFVIRKNGPYHFAQRWPNITSWWERKGS